MTDLFCSFRRWLKPSILLQSILALILTSSWSNAQQANPPHRNPPALPRTSHSSRAVRPGQAVAATPAGPGPSASLNTNTWTPIGPASLNSGGGLVSGRITGIAVDPSNPANIYIAAAGGGVWKTIDGGAAWSPITDNEATLAMGSIAIAPSNPAKLYAGTGEANNSGDSNFGLGILVSDDAGAHWALHNPGGKLTGVFIGQIAVHPTNADIAYAAVGGSGENGVYTHQNGIWKTTDGGATWTNVTAATSLTSVSAWSSVLIDPNTPTIVYAAVGDAGDATFNNVYRSMDSGQTWAPLANFPHDGGTGRIALAVSPAAKDSGKHVLYVAVASQYTGGLYYFARSDNSDAAAPTFTDLTAGTPDFLGAENGGGQGWYDIAVNVDGNGVVYCAGVENYNAGGSQAVIRSANLGVTWTDISIVSGIAPHTDNHAMAFDSSNRMLLGNDGGVYRYDSTVPSWTNLNSNINTIQFTGIGLHPSSLSTVVGGSQDNGTELYSDNKVWNEVEGGDGGMALFSSTNPTRCYAIHPFASYGPADFFRRSDSSCAPGTWVSRTAGLSGNPNFNAPFVVDPQNGDHLLLGTDGIFETTNGGDSWTNIGTPGVGGFNPSGNSVDSVALAPVNGVNPQHVYAATGGGFSYSSNIYVTSNGGTAWADRSLPSCTVHSSLAIGCRVNQIVTDPSDVTGQTAFAVTSNFSATASHVYRTTTAGLTWTDITGNLPDLPTWSVQVDTDANHTAYVATETGVYSSPSPYSTWAPAGTGLPHAQGADLQLNRSLHVLAIATHGRGAWEILTPGAVVHLTVAKLGLGSGTVTSSPAGINCGATCSAPFPAPVLVTLTANPGTNSQVANWSGCDSASGATCTVAMSQAESVSVTFNAVPVVTWPAASPITYGQTLTNSTLTGGSAANGGSPVSGTFAFDSPSIKPPAGVQAEAVTFTPADLASFASVSGSVNIIVNKAAPILHWTTPASISYGTALTTTQLNATADVPGTFSYTPAAGTVLGAGTQTLTVTFTPTDSANYYGGFSSVPLTVNKAALVVAANNVSVAHGASVPTLTGTVTGLVAGDAITATYTTAATPTSPVGTYAITATLNDPGNKLGNYSVTNTPGVLTITKATPVITWGVPAAITYGTALSATQLNAGSTVAGTFTYSPAIGTVLGAGSRQLSVTFTPTDTANYNSASANVTLVVNQATPSITWANPAPIAFGTALGATQLNATASVPGTFVYSPAAGTVPAAGTSTLSTTFTPTDSVDYKTATATVTISVANPVPVNNMISPATARKGDAPFTLTVNGAGFIANSTVLWGGSPLVTQYVSATQLTAQVPAANIAAAGTATITVQTPAPGGGTSNSLQFEVDSAEAGVAPPNFTTLTISVTPGATATYPVTLPAGAKDVSVSCLNLPTGAQCSYAAGTLTVTTTAATPLGSYQLTVVFTETVPGKAAALLLLPFLLLPLAKFSKKMRNAANMGFLLCVAAILTIAATAVGCGGGGTAATHQVTSSGTVTLNVH